jgi:alpha-glucosidase
VAIPRQPTGLDNNHHFIDKLMSMITRLPWWRSSVGYEIYVSSFQDSNGDGLGDLPGVIERLDYLEELGVDLLWLTPFFPSPLKDQGYDISNYEDVDSRFGVLGDLDRLVVEAHRRGMRVVFDLVVNHSSSEHPWFLESRSSPENARRDWYIWREGKDGVAGLVPPNNWVSYFGGPAWTFDDATKQWWLHLFLSEQPDLNWANPAVGAAINDMLEFWMQRGVDGFRVDTAHLFTKHPDLPDLPERPDFSPEFAGAGRVSNHDRFLHIYDTDQPDVLDVHRLINKVTSFYGGVNIGEVYLDDPAKVVRYVQDQDAVNLSFHFGLVEFGWHPQRIVDEIARALVLAPHVAWVLSSHDSPRAVSRYTTDDATHGRERTLALHTLLFGLPGTPFLYQGEELALTNGIVPPDRFRDPIALAGEAAHARDIARTPMPWSPDSSMHGFTSANDGWLPEGGRVETDTALWQRARNDSWFARYRALIKVRRTTPQLITEPVEWIDSTPASIKIRRGAIHVVANLTDLPAGITPHGEVLYSTKAVEAGHPLPPRTTAFVRSNA